MERLNWKLNYVKRISYHVLESRHAYFFRLYIVRYTGIRYWNINLIFLVKNIPMHGRLVRKSTNSNNNLVCGITFFLNWLVSKQIFKYWLRKLKIYSTNKITLKEKKVDDWKFFFSTSWKLLKVLVPNHRRLYWAQNFW